MKYSKIINKLRINNEVSWNLTVQNWTVFISLYRSLYRYRVRVPIYGRWDINADVPLPLTSRMRFRIIPEILKVKRDIKKKNADFRFFLK